MTPVQFIEFLESPGKLDDKSLPQLDEIVKTFPYCQSAHLLLAINLHHQKSIHYPAQLKRAAIYALDRKMLYGYIMQPGVVSVIERVEEMERLSDKETKKQNDKETRRQRENEKISEGAVAEEQECEKTSNTESEKKGIDADKKNISPLEKEILKEAISASILKEVMEEQASSAQEETPEGLSTLVKSISGKKTRVSDVIGLNISSEQVGGSASPYAGKTGTPEKISIGQPQTFNQWLKIFSKEAEMKTLPVEENNDLEITSEFFSPTNLARMSAVDDESFVTETLAKIHAKQGNYSKAIRIYELLIDQNPEKEKEYRKEVEEIKKIKNNEE